MALRLVALGHALRQQHRDLQVAAAKRHAARRLDDRLDILLALDPTETSLDLLNATAIVLGRSLANLFLVIRIVCRIASESLLDARLLPIRILGLQLRILHGGH